MRSKVAEAVREEQRAENAALSIDERLKLMLELGENQLQLYMSIHGVSRDEAMRRIEHAKQAGRQPSRTMEAIIDESRPSRPQDS
jgi:endonuclease V-like protein UPF0215 family